MRKVLFCAALFFGISTFSNAYFMTGAGTASMSWPEPGRASVSCSPSSSTCWGLGEEDGRWYIDVIGFGSWWLNNQVEPTEDPVGSNEWNIDNIGEPK